MGTFVRSPRDSITIAAADSTLSYGLDAVTRLEVSEGYRSHWLVGAGVGFVAGAGITFLVVNGGSTSICDRSDNQDAASSGECIGLVALGGVAGAGVGAIIGSLIRTERWQDVPVERVRVGLAPRGGVDLGLVVAF